MAGFRFVLRDDDTSYFTDPGEIETSYAKWWDWCPVSLAIIPFALETHAWGDPERFHQGTVPHPLAGNSRLVAFLREGIAEGRLSPMLHGWQHRYERGRTSGVWIPEFVHLQNPGPCLLQGRQHLEETLGHPVSVFVPPSNALSRAAYSAVHTLGFHLTQFHRARTALLSPYPSDLAATLRRLRARALGHGDHHDVLAFGARREMPAIFLTARSKPAEVFAKLSAHERLSGAICIATHYWELDKPLLCGGGTIRELLDEAIAWMRWAGGHPMTAQELLAS